MEGLSLLLLVPAIVVSLVLVFWFTGCSFSITVGPAAPTNLTVVAVTATTATLSWQYFDVVGYSFELERTREGDSVPQVIPISAFPTAAIQVEDTNLEPDTNYLYQVRAVNIETDVSSGPSNSAFVTTLP